MSENPMDALRVMSPDAVSKAEMFGQQFTEMLKGVENGTGTMDFTKVQAMVSNLRGVGPAPAPAQAPRTMRIPNGQVGQEPPSGGPAAPSPEQVQALRALMGAGGMPGGAGGAAGAPQAIMQALMAAGGDPKKAEALLRRQAAAQRGGKAAAPAPAGVRGPQGKRPAAAAPAPAQSVEAQEAPVYEAASELGEAIEAILQDRMGYYIDRGVGVQVLLAVGRERADVSVISTDPRVPGQQVIQAERVGIYPEDLGKALRSVIVRAHRNLVSLYGPPPEARVDGADEDEYDGDEYDGEDDYDLEDED